MRKCHVFDFFLFLVLSCITAYLTPIIIFVFFVKASKNQFVFDELNFMQGVESLQMALDQ